MAQPISTQHGMMRGSPAAAAGWRRRSSGAPPALARSCLLGALALWFHYGTAVFFEMIAAGISACF